MSTGVDPRTLRKRLQCRAREPGFYMTDSYQQIIAKLSRAKRVLVTTHVRPDGDALGSVTAMVLAMRHVGIQSEVLLLTHLPRKYAFIFHEDKIEYHDAEQGFPPGLSLD